jgi:hypothetical protein
MRGRLSLLLCGLAHRSALAAVKDEPKADVALYVPLDLQVPHVTGGSSDLRVLVPTRPSDGSRIANPTDLYASVTNAWESVVATQQAGLMDAKAPHVANSPLHEREAWHHYTAGQQGVVDSARFLITFTAVPSVQSGGSALHLAAAVGAGGRVSEILAADASASVVDAVNGYGHTPLIHACAMGHAAVVRQLLAAGADVERRGYDGCTPLMIAAAFGHAHVVTVLLSEGRADASAVHAFAGSTALHFAAEIGSQGSIEAICAAAPRAYAARTSSGGQPLHTAADCNQSMAIPALIACGADVNSLLAGDTTPVYLAAQRGFSEVVKALAAAGADLDFAMPVSPFSGGVVDPQGSARVGYAPVNTKVRCNCCSTSSSHKSSKRQRERVCSDCMLCAHV